MTVKNDAAARAAAEAAARRAAEAAERKRAEAARQQAAERAKQAAAQAAKQKKSPSVADKATLTKKAGDKPSASAVRQAFGKDELSKGLGRALRQRSAALLGGPASVPFKAPAGSADTLARRLGPPSRAWDPTKTYTRHTLTADSAERKAKFEARQLAADQKADGDARQVQAARESYLAKCAQNEQRLDDGAATLANIDALNETLAALPEAQRAPFLASIQPQVEQLVTDVTALGKGDTKKAVEAFAKCVETAGPTSRPAATPARTWRSRCRTSTRARCRRSPGGCSPTRSTRSKAWRSMSTAAATCSPTAGSTSTRTSRSRARA